VGTSTKIDTKGMVLPQLPNGGPVVCPLIEVSKVAFHVLRQISIGKDAS
jgi:hypothetical protein